MRSLAVYTLLLFLVLTISADDNFRQTDLMGHRASYTPVSIQDSPPETPRTDPTWLPLGPFGGDADDVATSPINPDIVLAGLAPSSGTGGLYRSTDGGISWAEVTAISGNSVYDIEFTPSGICYIATDNSVRKSINDGASWTTLNLGIGPNDQIYEVAIDPTNENIIWAGVADAMGTQTINVIRSTNGGASWSNMTPPMAAPLSCHGIALNPTNTNEVFACFGGGFGGGEVWVSSNGGTSWSYRMAGLPGNPMTDLIHDGGRVYLSGGRLFGSQHVGVYMSANLGVTWTALHDGTWPLLMINDLEFDPNDPSIILAASAGAGVFRTDDRGATWEFGVGGTAGFSSNSVRFSPGSSSLIYLGSSSLGIFKSSDGGVSFLPSSVGIGELDVWAAHANPLDTTEMAIAFQGLNDGGVYTSLNGGLTWTLEDLPGTRYSNVRFAPDGTLFAVSDGPTSIADEGVYKRKGDGWVCLGPDQGPNYESELVPLRFSINNPDLILTGGADFGNAGFEGTIWRSVDGGLSWRKEYESPVDYWFFSDIEILEDGTDQTMLAGYKDVSGSGSGGLMRSVDMGDNWIASTSGLPANVSVGGLAASAADVNKFYLANRAVSGGLYKSIDAGLSWISTGYNDGPVESVEADQLWSDRLYIRLWNAPMIHISSDDGVRFTPYSEGLEGSGWGRQLVYVPASQPMLLLATTTGTYKIETTGDPTAAPLDGFEDQRAGVTFLSGEAVSIGAGELRYLLSEAGEISIGVYNLQGRRLASLHEGFQSTGTHEHQWETATTAAGVYFYRIQTRSGTAVRKFVLVD